MLGSHTEKVPTQVNSFATCSHFGRRAGRAPSLGWVRRGPHAPASQLPWKKSLRLRIAIDQWTFKWAQTCKPDADELVSVRQLKRPDIFSLQALPLRPSHQNCGTDLFHTLAAKGTLACSVIVVWRRCSHESSRPCCACPSILHLLFWLWLLTVNGKR